MPANGVVNQYYALPDDAQEEVALAMLESEEEQAEEEQVEVSEQLNETLDYLVKYDSSSGTSATETAAHLNIKLATATYRLNALVHKGLAHKVSPGMFRAGPGDVSATKSKRGRPKADYDEIKVSRVYRHCGTGLSVTVGEDGGSKMPKVNLSAEEMRAVMLLSQRIAEMNELLGLGKK